MTSIRLGTARIGNAPAIVVGSDNGCARVADVVGGGGPVPATLLELIEDWSRWEQPLSTADVPALLDPAELEWLPPLMPRKLMCIGANYGRHNAEMLGGVDHPHPYCFLKPPTTTLVGSGSAVRLPAHAKQIDYEVELAIVIGRRAFGVRDRAALDSIFGYSVLNDLSARDFIPAPTFLGLDWVMLKGFDGSSPMGPWLTPARFVPDPMDLRISLSVNGEVRQDGSTGDMIFGVQRLVEHLSSVMTLEPGDVIATGTPAGVAFGRKPPPWLRAGDRIEAEVEGLGTLVTVIAPVAEPTPVEQ